MTPKFRAWDKAFKRMLKVASINFACDRVGYYVKGKQIAERNHLSDELVLMQFTNLQDSKGKDVYEGDILHDILHTEQYFVVEWQDGGFRLKLLIPKLSTGGDEDIDTVGEMEIVGNVHQNPEFEAVE